MSDKENATLLLKWLEQKMAKQTFKEKLSLLGFSKIAVAGFRAYGRLLVKDFQNEGVSLCCIIEKNHESLRKIESVGVPIIGFDSDFAWNNVDVIVVTPDLDFVNTRENLEIIGVNVPLIGLDELLVLNYDQ